MMSPCGVPTSLVIDIMEDSGTDLKVITRAASCRRSKTCLQWTSRWSVKPVFNGHLDDRCPFIAGSGENDTIPSRCPLIRRWSAGGVPWSEDGLLEVSPHQKMVSWRCPLIRRWSPGGVPSSEDGLLEVSPHQKMVCWRCPLIRRWWCPLRAGFTVYSCEIYNYIYRQTCNPVQWSPILTAYFNTWTPVYSSIGCLAILNYP